MRQTDWLDAREQGRAAERACAEKAVRVTGLDLDGAREYVLKRLERGAQGGEDLVDALKRAGFRGHDDRCFGAVFSQLARRKLITCVGYAPRRRGHGTAGGRIWALA